MKLFVFFLSTGLTLWFFVYPGIYILQGKSIFWFTPLALNLIFGTVNYFLAAMRDPGFIKRSNLTEMIFVENDRVKDLYGN